MLMVIVHDKASANSVVEDMVAYYGNRSVAGHPVRGDFFVVIVTEARGGVGSDCVDCVDAGFDARAKVGVE